MVAKNTWSNLMHEAWAREIMRNPGKAWEISIKYGKSIETPTKSREILGYLSIKHLKRQIGTVGPYFVRISLYCGTAHCPVLKWLRTKFQLQMLMRHCDIKAGFPVGFY